MSSKFVWKMMMYTKPSWWLIGRLSESREAQEAAEEYEEEMAGVFVFLLVLAVIGGLVVGGLWVFGVI